MAPSNTGSNLPLWVQMITGGIAGSVAEVFIHLFIDFNNILDLYYSIGYSQG